jgi:hypothetical protein
MGGHLFGVAAFVQPAFDPVLRNLPEGQFLKGSDLSTHAGFYMGEIKAIHSRMATVAVSANFIRELGGQAGFVID